MKTLAQIFVILILIMSIVFMTLMTTVYVTHKNWKEIAAQKTVELQKVQGELKSAKDQIEIAKGELDKLTQDNLRNITALNEQILELNQANQQLIADKNVLDTNQAKIIASIETVHKTLENSRTEITNNRVAFRTLQQEFAAKMTQLAQKSSEAQERALTLATLKDVSKDLLKQYADAIQVLNINDLKPEPSLYTGVPPTVEGLVTEVRPGNGGNSMVEISLGEDDGLIKGHQLYVYRSVNGKSSLLGKVEVVGTEPNRSACKVLADYRQGNIQRDDYVASKLN